MMTLVRLDTSFLFILLPLCTLVSSAVVSLKNQGYLTPSTTTEIPWTERWQWSQRLQLTKPKETPSSISWALADEGITFGVAMPASAEYGQLTFTNPHPEERAVIDVVVLWTNGTDFFAEMQEHHTNLRKHISQSSTNSIIEVCAKSSISPPNKDTLVGDFNAGVEGNQREGSRQDELASKIFEATDAVLQNGTIKKDKLENWVLENGQMNSTHLSFIFSRAWKTCDDDEDYPLGLDTAMMNWTIFVQTPKNQVIFGKATSGTINGSMEIQFWQPEISREKTKLERYKTWEMRMGQVKIDEDAKNLHWCQLFRTPRLDRKHWIIGFEPKLQNPEYIQRMLLYECRLDTEDMSEMEKAVNKGGQCISGDMYKAWHHCESVITFLWAPGSEGVIFPEKRGIPIGGKHKETTYFLLQVQYELEPDHNVITDRPGLDMLYTDRKGYTDAGSILFGHRAHPFLVLPPMKTEFVVRGWCTFEKEEIPGDKGMDIFSIMLHTNKFGRKVVIRHFRDGHEMKPIIKDDGFQHEVQQHRKLPRDVNVMAGDTIVIECHYNTMTRDQLTYGGIMSNNEVCVAQLFTTPPSNLLSCLSRPSRRSFIQAIHLKKVVGLEEHMRSVHQLIQVREEKDMEDEIAIPATMSTNMSSATTRNHETSAGTKEMANTLAMDVTHTTEASRSTVSGEASTTTGKIKYTIKPGITEKPERRALIKSPTLGGIMLDMGNKMFDQLLVEEENADATATPHMLGHYIQNFPKPSEPDSVMLNENLLMGDYISYHILNGPNSELEVVSQVKAPMKIINLQNMTESCTGVWSSSLNEQAFLQNGSSKLRISFLLNAVVSIVYFTFIFQIPH